MADSTTPQGENSALQSDSGVTIPRISLKETGFSAIKMTSTGKIVEEANLQFRYPQMLKVVAEMKYSPPVSIGLSAINILMNRAEVTVLPVVGETALDKSRRDYLLSVLHDMDNSWQATMQAISTYKEYGHQVSEIVYRRRLSRNGSKYNDGLVGLAGLRNRPQNSISRWNFSEDGRKLESISQSLNNLPNNAKFQSLLDENGLIVIPRDKFLLFRSDPVDDNPEGVSILRSAYLAYKQLSLITDNMMVGISKDSSAIPYAQLHPKYMNPDASAEDAAVYAGVKTMVENIVKGEQSAVVFPKLIDPNTNEDVFHFELLEQKAGKAYDIPTIIKMLQANILSVLGCDSILMGAEKGGSLSLQDSNTNMLALQVAYRLSEIANTLNTELVPKLWAANGWSADRLPKIGFKDVSSVSLEEFSKYIQRVMSVGGLEMDRGVMNKIREVGGFEVKPEDEEIDKENLSTTLAGKSTSAGEGMAVGVTGDGTSTKPGGKDNSAQNKDNKA
jgi:hypothetical protein